MPKLHRCPECGQSHSGFTDRCGECLANVTTNVTPDRDAAPTSVTTNVTGRGFGSGKGRARIHGSNAERQAAYRLRAIPEKES